MNNQGLTQSMTNADGLLGKDQLSPTLKNSTSMGEQVKAAAIRRPKSRGDLRTSFNKSQTRDKINLSALLNDSIDFTTVINNANRNNAPMKGGTYNTND